jgi:hypothetical protein
MAEITKGHELTAHLLTLAEHHHRLHRHAHRLAADHYQPPAPENAATDAARQETPR